MFLFVCTLLVLISTAFAHLVVLVPFNGEVIPSGTTTTISWEPSTNPSNSTLAIILEQRESTGLVRVVRSLASSGVANSGSFQWTVDRALPLANNYFIRLQTGADTDWAGGLGDSPPQPGGRFGVSGVFTINSNTTTSTSTLLPTSSGSITSTSLPPSDSPLSPVSQPTQAPFNATVTNDDPTIVYHPPEAWHLVPAQRVRRATNGCTASPSEEVSNTIDSTISFSFTGELLA